MKKLLTIMLASALVLGIAAPSMAMHFEMNGQLRVRSWYLDQYWPETISGDQKGDMEFVDQRFRTFMTWGLTENVLLKARADINEGFWGSNIGVVSEPSDVTDPISGQTASFSTPSSVSAKTPISFDWVYMQFTWPGAPLTMLIGRQDVSWGTGMFAKADPRDRLKAVYKFGDWSAGIAYDKNDESFTQELTGIGSDNRSYVAFLVGNVSDWKLGFLYALNRNESNTLNPVQVLLTGEVGPIVRRDVDTHFFDVSAIGATGPVSWKGELLWATGTDKTFPVEVDREGFLAYVGGFFNAGMANLGLEYAYAQGNDAGDGKVKGVAKMDQHTPYNSVIFFNGLDYAGYDKLYLANNDNNGVPGGNTPGADQNFANAWSLKGTVSASPTEKLTLIGAVLYAERNEVLANVDKEMGWEVDGILSYAIYDNLAYTLGLGYAWVGDFYTNSDGSSPDNPWGMMNRIEVKF
jgi:hypothetical protein